VSEPSGLERDDPSRGSVAVTSERIGIGVLGAAAIAPRAILYPAREGDGVEVVAIASRSRDRAEALASKFKIPHVWSSYEEVIADDDVDAVYIALPASLHHQWSARALQAGKHVLCEKPITTNLADARDLVQMAAGRSLVLAEAFHYRYHPYLGRIADLVRERVGEIIAVEVVFSNDIETTEPIYWDSTLGGGALFHVGCYAVHCIRSVTGEELEVDGAAAIWINGVDVTLSAELRLPNGAPVRLRTSMTSPLGFENWLWIRGEEGELSASNFVIPQLSAKVAEYASAVRVRRVGEPTYVEVADPVYSYTCQLRAFAEAIRTGTTMLTSGTDIVNNMSTIEDILRAARLSVWTRAQAVERR